MKSWLPTVCYCALDVALAAGASYMFGEDGSEPILFLFILAVLWLLPMGIGLWNLAKFWIGYFVFTRERMVRFYLSEFHRLKFPSSLAFFDGDTYLNHIMESGGAENLAGLKAAYLSGEISGYRTFKPLTMSIATLAALEEAMSRYSREHSGDSNQ